MLKRAVSHQKRRKQAKRKVDIIHQRQWQQSNKEHSNANSFGNVYNIMHIHNFVIPQKGFAFGERNQRAIIMHFNEVIS